MSIQIIGDIDAGIYGIYCDLNGFPVNAYGQIIGTKICDPSDLVPSIQVDPNGITVS